MEESYLPTFVHILVGITRLDGRFNRLGCWSRVTQKLQQSLSCCSFSQLLIGPCTSTWMLSNRDLHHRTK